jgi:hypothetical protein
VSGCFREATPLTVTITNPPAPPSLAFNILNCSPYMLELTATGAAGTYNWSNGMSGSTIQTPFGGAYKVTLTDASGCQVSNTIDAPKDLKEYIWIFPTGCFCNTIPNAQVLGPLKMMDYQLKNVTSMPGYIVASGPSKLLPTPINPGNNYTLTLSDNGCTLTSGVLYYSLDTCNKLNAGSTGGKPIEILVQFTHNISLMESAGENDLMAVPNPAQTFTELHYYFVGNSYQRSIEVVDMLGRRVLLVEPSTDWGVIKWRLDDVPSGQYQIIMRRNGEQVQRKALSIVK